MTKRRIILCVLILLVLSTVAYIFLNSAESSVVSNQKSQAITEKIQDIVDPKSNMDESVINVLIRKSAHFLEFTLLGFELYLLFSYATKRVCGSFLFTVFFFSLSIAVTDEFIQLFSGRTSAVEDVILDFSGAMCGMSLSLLVIFICSLFTKKGESSAAPSGDFL